MRLADCYRVLELHSGASEEEVRRAHRDLTKVWHPDRFEHDAALRSKAEEKLKEINAAYATIRDQAAGAWPDAEGGKDRPGAWRVRARGREARFADLESIARLVERGVLRIDADVFDPTTGHWVPLETIPRLCAALARASSKRSRGWAFTCALLAVLILVRRPTPATVVIALVLGVAAYLFARRARARDSA